MNAATLLERVADRTSRRRGLEIAFIAHVVLDTTTVDPVAKAAASGHGYRLRLSASAGELLDLILEAPAAARLALVEYVKAVCSCADVVDVVDLAADVATVTVEELGAVGVPSTVLALLERQVHDEQVEPQRHDRLVDWSPPSATLAVEPESRTVDPFGDTPFPDDSCAPSWDTTTAVADYDGSVSAAPLEGQARDEQIRSRFGAAWTRQPQWWNAEARRA